MSKRKSDKKKKGGEFKTAAISEKYYKIEGDVSIPSPEAVEDAKEWVEENEK